MKNIIALLSLAIISSSAVAQADGLPTAWPVHTQMAMAPEPEATPPTGMTYFFTGVAMTTVGTGISSYGIYQGMHSTTPNVTAGYALLVGGGTVALAGTVFSFIGLFQAAHYQDWQAKHPIIAGLSVSPTSAAYHLAF